MRRIIAAVVVIAAVFGGWVGSAFAQEGGFTVDSVEVRDYPEVALVVTLENQLLGDETPVFLVRENGGTRRVVVESAASEDLKVVLALDVSGSMRGAPLDAAKAAASQFVTRMPAGVEVAVVSFGNSPALAAEFTDDKATLLTAIDLLAARGETALYDGLDAAATLLGNEAEEGRTIVLVSDGGDTVSTTGLEDVISRLEGLGAAFYAVELQSPENDSEALQALAAATGGSVIPADDPDALEALFDGVASELLSSYRLLFTAAAFGESSLTIHVLAGGTVVASGTRSVEFPPAIVETEPAPAVAEDPDPAGTSNPAPGAVPARRTGSTVTLSWLETRPASWTGATAIFLAFAIVLTTIALRPAGSRRRRDRSTLTEFSSRGTQGSRRSALSTIAESASALAEQSLHRSDRLRSLNAALERAGVALRPGEFLVLVASGVIAAAAVGLLLLNVLFALLFATIVVMIVPLRLSSRSSERSTLFNEQLGDTLQLMSASMRAGYGLLQAVDAVAEEAPSPTAEEFQRIKIETHLGRDLDDSLKAAAARVDSEDFRWVAEAIEIHRQIGGDLAEILDAVNETIRDRNRIRRRIKSLSAEGRISAVILSLIPIALILVISVINPAYIGELPATGLGQGLIVFGVIAWMFAVVWMRRIVRLIF